MYTKRHAMHAHFENHFHLQKAELAAVPRPRWCWTVAVHHRLQAGIPAEAAEAVAHIAADLRKACTGEGQVGSLELVEDKPFCFWII